MLKRFVFFLFYCTSALAEEVRSVEALIYLVHQDCGSCHGLTLKGGLGPDIRPRSLMHYNIDTLASVVLDGIPGTAMPPWRPLMSEVEARKIAEYLLRGDLK